RLLRGGDADESALRLYEDIAIYLIYRRHRVELHATIAALLRREGAAPAAAFWESFLGDFHHFLTIRGRSLPSKHDPAHLFACFVQVRRAFHEIYHHLVGESQPVARLRG